MNHHLQKFLTPLMPGFSFSTCMRKYFDILPPDEAILLRGNPKILTVLSQFLQAWFWLGTSRTLLVLIRVMGKLFETIRGLMKRLDRVKMIRYKLFLSGILKCRLPSPHFSMFFSHLAKMELFIHLVSCHQLTFFVFIDLRFGILYSQRTV